MNRGRYSLRLLRIGLAVLIAGWSAAIGSAADPPIRFFRLLVPEDRLGDFKQLHWPVPKAEFDKMLQALQPAEVGRVPAADIRVVRGKHRAVFDGTQLVEGDSTLTLERRVKSPAFLVWENLNLTVNAAIWQEATPRAAVLGLGSTGEQGLWVDSDADLRLKWSLRGRSTPEAAAEFTVTVPAATVTTLEIESGPNVRLEAEDGIAAEETKLTPPTESAEPGRLNAKLWKLTLGARPTAKFRFLSLSAPATLPPRVLWRESLDYDINPSSIDIHATWNLDIADTALTQLVIRGEKDVAPAEIRLGDRSLTWTMTPNPQGWSAVVVLPEPLSGKDRQLIVRALAPVKIGGRRRLPRLLLDGAVWREGESQVSVAEPLRIDEVTVADGRQIAFAGETATDMRSALRFQHFSRDSVPEIALSRSTGALRSAAGTLVQVDTHRLTAVSQWELWTEAGERFSAEFELPRAWILDSVETTPPELLEDRVVTPVSGQRQRLEIRLRQPIRPDRKLKLTLRGHCRRPSQDEGITNSLLRLATLRDSNQTRRLTAVEILDAAMQLQVVGDAAVEHLAAAQLTDDERRLLPSAGNLLFVDDERADALQLILERRRPRFAAATRHQIVVEPHRLDHQVTIRCVPEGTSPRRMTVRLAAPSAAIVDWQYAALGSSEGPVAPAGETPAAPRGGNRSEFSARRLAASQDDRGAETWSLEWNRPPVGPFEITARFSQGFDARQPLPLFSVLEATSQSGGIEVRSSTAGIFELDAPETEPLPLDGGAVAGAPLRARLRYEPARAGTAAIVPRAGPAVPPVHIRRLQLVSRFGVDGGALHHMRLELQNDGGSALRFRLPAGAQLLQAAVDGGQLEADYRPGATAVWRTAALPADQQQPLAEMTYTTPAPAGSLPRWDWPVSLPEFESPVMERSWRVWTPPGFVLADAVPERGTSAAEADRHNGAAAGWTSFQIPWPSSGARSLAFVRPPQSSAMRAAFVLAAAGLALFWGRIGVSKLLPFVIFAGALVWLAPAGWHWLPEGILWGLAIAAAVQACLPDPTQKIDPTPSRRSDSGLQGAAALTAVMFGALIVHADEPTKPPAAAPTRPAAEAPYTVLIPVDKDGKPKDDYVFVDPRFHALLKGATEKTQARELGWLLRGAEYRVVFRPSIESDLALHETVVAWDLMTFKPNARVRLPLNLDDVVVLSAGIRIGEQEIPIDWDRENGRLTFTVEEPGRHRLQFAFRPKTSVTPEGRSASIVIPRVATARVTMESPAVGPEIECLADGVRFIREAASPEAAFDIGAAGRLQIRWRDSGTASKDLGTVGDQLLWWKVRPSAVSVDALLRLRPGKDPLTAVDVEIDPRLRLLPPDAALKLKVESLVEGPKTVKRFTLAEPTTREVVIPLTFQYQGTSGLGRFVPPRIALKADRMLRTWSAVSVAAGLTAGAVDRTGTEPLTPQEFAGAWSTETLPDAAFRSIARTEAWGVEIRPLEASSKVEEELSVAYTGEHVRLQLTAEITGLGAKRFLQRLRTPADFQVERVEIEDLGEARPSTWSLNKGMLTVLVRDAVECDKRRVTVVGRVPHLNDGPVPRLTTADVEQKQCRVRIFRGESLLLACTPIAPFSLRDRPQDEKVSGWGRLAAEIVAAEPDVKETSVPATLRVTPNRPQIVGRILTRVERGGTGWSARVDLEFDVRDGVLDQLPLQVPAEWAAPKVLTPDVEARVRVVTGQPRRRLVLEPLLPWSGKQTISLQGPLASSDAGLRVPEVIVQDNGDWERWVVLPKRAAPDVLWSLSGLQQASPPLESASEDWDYYRVVAPRFEATVKSVDRAPGNAVSPLAVTRLERSAEGRVTGATHFELIPHGITHVGLHTPDGLRLVRVTVAGRPALVRETGSQSWRIDVASARLPQDIGVDFEVTSALVDAALDLPQLDGVKIEKSLCYVIDAGLPASSAPHAKQILDAYAVLLETDAASARAALIAAESSDAADTAAVWFARRGPRFDMRLKTALNLLPAGEKESAAAERISAAGRAFAAAEQQAGGRREGADIPPLLEFDPPTEHVLAIHSTTGRETRHWLPAAAPPVSSSPNHLLIGLLLLGLAAAARSAAVLPAVQEWCRQQPHLTLALAGLFWTVLLPPAWFGWILVGAAVVSSFLPVMRPRRYFFR